MDAEVCLTSKPNRKRWNERNLIVGLLTSAGPEGKSGTLQSIRSEVVLGEYPLMSVVSFKESRFSWVIV